jgi:hypothetical protein
MDQAILTAVDAPGGVVDLAKTRSVASLPFGLRLAG